MHSSDSIEPSRVSLPTHPRRNPAILMGPPEYMNGKVAHYIKNSSTGRFHRIGEKEAFLLESMDGKTDLSALGDAYFNRFGKRLSDAALTQLFEQLRTKELLADDQPLESQKAPIVYRQGFLGFKLLVLDPDKFLDRLLPRVMWLFRKPFVISAILVSVLTEALVLPRFGVLWRDPVKDIPRSAIGIVALLVLFLALAVIHEFAHALTCKRYGGNVPEIGLVFRYLTIYPYTKVDDIALFHNRWNRVYVLAAGTLSSLLFVPLFGCMWLFSAPLGTIHQISRTMLIWYNFGTLLNVVPFLQLDGYFVLAHLLHAPNLRPDSYTYLRRMVFNTLGIGSPPPQYPSRMRKIFGTYGTLSLVVSAWIVGWLAYYEYTWLYRKIGWWAIPVAIAIVLTATYPKWKSLFVKSSSSITETTRVRADLVRRAG